MPIELNVLKLLGLELSATEKKKLKKTISALSRRYQQYQDPWGLNLNTIEAALKILLPIYKRYFKVRVFGLENVDQRPYIVASNHSGQIPIDGMLITLAFACETQSPRLLRGMVERFLAGLPFLGELTAETGSVLGDRKNCEYLLHQGESILVFPEGSRGISKSTSQYYQLQDFTKGFFRIALHTQTNILPVAVIGAEEMFPIVQQSPWLAKMLGLKLPSIPISANLIPLPSPIDIYIGKPFEIPTDLSHNAPDKELSPYIHQLEGIIRDMINEGLKKRRPFLDQAPFSWLPIKMKEAP